MTTVQSGTTIDDSVFTSYLKKRILVQDVGGSVFQTADIRRYVEDLEHAPNTQIGPKDFFEIVCSHFSRSILPARIRQSLSLDKQCHPWKKQQAHRVIEDAKRRSH